MTRNLATIISETQIHPSHDFEERVFLAVNSAQRQRKAVQQRFSWAGIAGSVILLVLTWIWGQEALLQTEFWSILQLFFSDAQVVGTDLGDFVLSLLETAPILPIIGILLALTLLFESLSILFATKAQGSKYRTAWA